MRKQLAAMVLAGTSGLVIVALWYGYSSQASAQSGQSFNNNNGQIPQESARTMSAEMALSPENHVAIRIGNSSTDEAAAAKINEALNSKVDIDFADTPLKEVVDALKAKSNIEIQLDMSTLKEASVGSDSLVNKKLHGVTLRSALRLILDDLQLKFVIHDGMLLIVSPTKAESDELLITKIYPVKDLVLVRNDKGEITTDFEPLIGAMTQTLATKTWQENGGAGTYAPFYSGDRFMLVVTQSFEVHEHLAIFFAALRTAGVVQGKATNKLLLPIEPPPPPQSPMTIAVGF